MAEAICMAVDCTLPVYCRGCCLRHYNKLKRHGNPNEPDRRAPSGTGYTNAQGYRMVRGKGEHVLVAERALGRPLPPDAVVHHVNHVRTDNCNTNLRHLSGRGPITSCCIGVSARSTRAATRLGTSAGSASDGTIRSTFAAIAPATPSSIPLAAAPSRRNADN